MNGKCACQVCGETAVLVQDHDILRCFDCIDAGRMPEGVETGSRVRAVTMRDDLMGVLVFSGVFLIGLAWVLWVKS